MLALHQLMTQTRVYRSEDLTVASLAQRLKTPEYRPRRVINRRLGHRNFNAFVNGFRIDEAKAALANPAQRELPVLSIASKSGFSPSACSTAPSRPPPASLPANFAEQTCDLQTI